MVSAAGLIHSASSFQSLVDMNNYVAKTNSANYDILLGETFPIRTVGIIYGYMLN